MVQRNLRAKGLTMTLFNKVFKLLLKPNSSIKISHLYKHQTKILIIKSKILGRKMTIYHIILSFSTAEGQVYKEEIEHFQPH